jgi:hypothetical protein
VNRHLLVLLLISLGLLWFVTRGPEKLENEAVDSVRGVEKGTAGIPTLRGVTITPPLPDLRSTLMANVQTDPPTFDRSLYRYRWLINGREVGQESTLPLTGFRQGDIVSVEVAPLHASDPSPSPSVTASIRIGNNPPAILSVRLVPASVFGSEAITAEVITEDREGDVVRLAYEWYVNQALLAGNDHGTLEGVQVHSADKISVRVTPFDPYSQGEPSRSPEITVLNRAPEILSDPPLPTDKAHYIYQVEAKDPDGDPLTYLLLEGPPGMTIHPASGQVNWKIVSLSGDHVNVRLEVSDAKGGRTIQTFTVQTKIR